MADNNVDEADANDYEAKRRRRMEENRRMLQSLNLPSLKRPRPTPRPQPRKNDVPQPRRKSERQQRQNAAMIESQRQQAEQKRRRLGDQNEQNQEAERQVRLQDQARREKELMQSREKYPPVIDLPPVYLCQLRNAPRGAKQEREPSPCLTIDVNDFHWRCLGRQVLPIGKKSVMQGMCPDGFMPWYFHKSNVQLWNNAMVLFIDTVGEAEATYREMFREDELDGQKVVHFQWHGEIEWGILTQDIVRHLQQAQRGDYRLRFHKSYYDKEDTDQGETNPLLLFVRHKKGPYIYCGRLGYLGHEPSSSPVEFRWQLLDVDHLNWTRVHGVLTDDLNSSV